KGTTQQYKIDVTCLAFNTLIDMLFDKLSLQKFHSDKYRMSKNLNKELSWLIDNLMIGKENIADKVKINFVSKYCYIFIKHEFIKIPCIYIYLEFNINNVIFDIRFSPENFKLNDDSI